MAVRPIFKLWHSIAGLLVLAIAEAVALAALPGAFAWLVPLCSIAGTAVVLYVATEIVEEIRSKPRLFLLLCGIIAEFILFFAFQYHLLGSFDPLSFGTLPPGLSSLILQSTMVFALNPLYMPGDTAGQLLLLVNTLGSLGLVLFVLQNIWQLRSQAKA
jgi:hypothetical protein